MQENTELVAERDKVAYEATQLEELAISHHDRLTILLHVLAQALRLPDELLEALASPEDDFEAAVVRVQDCIAAALDHAAGSCDAADSTTIDDLRVRSRSLLFYFRVRRDVTAVWPPEQRELAILVIATLIA